MFMCLYKVIYNNKFNSFWTTTLFLFIAVKRFIIGTTGAASAMSPCQLAIVSITISSRVVLSSAMFAGR